MGDAGGPNMSTVPESGRGSNCQQVLHDYASMVRALEPCTPPATNLRIKEMAPTGAIDQYHRWPSERQSMEPEGERKACQVHSFADPDVYSSIQQIECIACRLLRQPILLCVPLTMSRPRRRRS